MVKEDLSPLSLLTLDLLKLVSLSIQLMIDL
jgi:hypothetical protein